MKPTKRALVVVAVLVVLALLWPDAPVWPAMLGIVIAVMVADAYFAFRVPPPTVGRVAPQVVPVRSRQRLAATVRNEAQRAIELSVEDRLPDAFAEHTAEAQLTLASGEEALWQYDVHPTERGEVVLGDLVLMISSVLGLWRVRRRVDAAHTLRVFPDYNAIAEYLDLLADQQSQRLGLRRTQRRGEGLEFQQLREFRDGDSIRQVDWKATAKRRTLISKEYSEERDQSIVFLLDTGGRMAARDGLLSHFDHALNSLLLLSYVALRQGDTVAVQTFGPTERWIGGLRGTSAINRLLNELFDLQSESGAGDYVAAAEALIRKQRKRALVIVLSNLRQTDDDLLPAVRLLRQRHAVMVASLREAAVDRAMTQEVRTFEDALTVMGAHRYRQRRRDLSSKLSSSAQLVADCTPDRLPAQLVNGYWALKRAGAL